MDVAPEVDSYEGEVPPTCPRSSIPSSTTRMVLSHSLKFSPLSLGSTDVRKPKLECLVLEAMESENHCKSRRDNTLNTWRVGAKITHTTPLRQFFKNLEGAAKIGL